MNLKDASKVLLLSDSMRFTPVKVTELQSYVFHFETPIEGMYLVYQLELCTFYTHLERSCNWGLFHSD